MISCPSIQQLATILDASCEKALIVSEDWVVLHMNPAATSFLQTSKNIHEILVPSSENNDRDSWKNLTTARVYKQDGVSTRNERTVRIVPKLECVCGCQFSYRVVYIESKHEAVRSIVDHSMDPVVTIDEQGIIQTANPATHQVFGFLDHELIGQNISKLCGGDYAEHHNSYIETYLSSGVPKVIGKIRIVPCRHKDGHEFSCQLGLEEITPTESSATSHKRYFCGYLKDMTQELQHEAELKEKQELAQAMINASFDPMIEINEKGIMTMVNTATVCMFGYTREELIGSNVSLLCADDHASHHDEYLQRYLESGTKCIIGRKRHVTARRKDGSELQVELGVQEVTLGSGEKVFCGYIRDLTAQLKDKRALQKQKQMIHNNFFRTSSSDDNDVGANV